MRKDFLPPGWRLEKLRDGFSLISPDGVTVRKFYGSPSEKTVLDAVYAWEFSQGKDEWTAWLDANLKEIFSSPLAEGEPELISRPELKPLPKSKDTGLFFDFGNGKEAVWIDWQGKVGPLYRVKEYDDVSPDGGARIGGGEVVVDNHRSESPEWKKILSLAGPMIAALVRERESYRDYMASHEAALKKWENQNDEWICWWTELPAHEKVRRLLEKPSGGVNSAEKMSKGSGKGPFPPRYYLTGRHALPFEVNSEGRFVPATGLSEYLRTPMEAYLSAYQMG